MIGLKAVVICTTTSTKMIIQTFSPAFDLARECEKPFSRKRKPKKMAINPKTRCNTPIQAIDSVEVENNHAIGAKPIKRMVMRVSNPATNPQISIKRACEPLRQVKI